MSTMPRPIHLAARLALLVGILSPNANGAGPGQAPELPRRAGGDEAAVEYDDEGLPIQIGPTGVSLWGWTFRPGLNYRGFWTDNLFVFQDIEGNPESDFVHYISPAINLEKEWPGDARSISFSASYIPTFVVHSTKGEYDRDYHTVNGRLAMRFVENEISLGHTFSQTSEATTQIGLLAPQTINRTLLTYNRPVTGKIRVDADALQNLTDSDATEFNSETKLRDWQGTVFFDYEALPKTTIGLGGGGGYSEQEFGNDQLDMVNEQLLARVTYLATGKLVAMFRGGVQFNQAQSDGYQDPDPVAVFGATFNYQPRFGTGVSLNMDRTAGSAQFFGGQFLSQSLVSLGVTQRLYQTMSFSVRGGYTVGDFEMLKIGSTAASRDFTAWLANFNFTWRPQRLDWFSAGIFYQFQDRNSDLPQDTFTNHQVGLTLDFRL